MLRWQLESSSSGTLFAGVVAGCGAACTCTQNHMTNETKSAHKAVDLAAISWIAARAEVFGAQIAQINGANG